MRKILPQEFYLSEDVVSLSQQLLGKFLITEFQDGLTGGMIIETEAYKGPEDRASHAYANRRTKRNEVMYHTGGISYVYLCYGMHHLFNVVTNQQETPHAILVRALAPTDGIPLMLQRRKKTKIDRTLTNGPGTVSQALGITTQMNGTPLTKAPIWIEDRGVTVDVKHISCSPRVGIDYAGEDALLPWRFQWSPKSIE